MYCPKCGTQIPDGSQVCNSCGFSIAGYPAASRTAVITKTSGLAIAAIICGILTPITCGITAILAIIFGIIALVNINKSGGALKGNGLAIAGIALPVVLLPFIAILMGILMPSLARVRTIAQRVVCGSNMSSLGNALQLYANKNGDQYPTADKWCDLLVENGNVSQKSFRCRGAFEGPCNYAMNRNIQKLGTASPPNMVLLFETSPGWNQSGGPEILTFENHKVEGCNILFNDGHIEFIRTEDLDKLLWRSEEEIPK